MDNSTLSDDSTTRVSSRIRRCLRDGEAVFEKQYTTDDWGATVEVIRRRAARELSVLQSIEASGQFRRRLGVVRLASCDPQQATIATYEVQGQSLASWLRAQRQHRYSLLPRYLAGAWLRKFQTLPLADSAFDQLSEKDPSNLIDYCDLRLRSLHALGYRWPDAATHRRLLIVLENLEDVVAEVHRRAVWVHADYSPGNLMWGEGVLTPIDFANVRTGSTLDDATYLIHRLEMQHVYRPWRRLPVAAIGQAILRGLGQPDAAEGAAYRAMMIRHLVCRLHTYVRRPARGARQSLHDRWVRLVIRRRLSAAAGMSAADTGAKAL